MTADRRLEELIQEGRPAPSAPVRLGRHDVLVEATGYGTSVYLVRGGRVLTLRANTGYREDVAIALLDATAGLMDADDLGDRVHLRPIEVPGFALDRAALLGPGRAHFFRGKPALAGLGLQVVPVHRSETADGEACERFEHAVLGKGLAVRHHDWTRDPRPRADVRRLDDLPDGPYAGNRKPTVRSAQDVLDREVPDLMEGVRLSLRDMRGRELRLHREWDRIRGTLHVPGEAAAEVSVPRSSAWRALGPLFLGGEVDSAALSGAAAEPHEAMLEMRVNDRERGRHDERRRPQALDGCLRWLRALAPTDGNFLVFAGRSGGVVQMIWQEGPRLWLEAPEPAHRRSRGRHVTLEEAERMITILAEQDRVAVDDLGDLRTVAH